LFQSWSNKGWIVSSVSTGKNLAEPFFGYICAM
jgi:hypothetical protein